MKGLVIFKYIRLGSRVAVVSGILLSLPASYVLAGEPVSTTNKGESVAENNRGEAVLISVVSGEKKEPVRDAAVLLDYDPNTKCAGVTSSDGGALLKNARQGEGRCTITVGGNLIYTKMVSVNPGKKLEIIVGDKTLMGQTVDDGGLAVSGSVVVLSTLDRVDVLSGDDRQNWSIQVHESH